MIMRGEEHAGTDDRAPGRWQGNTGRAYQVTSPILTWYRDRGILVSVDAMRSAQEVGREILAALEAMHPLLDHVPAHARLPVDLTGLGKEFGATGVVAA